MSLLVVLPVFNEEGALDALLRRFVALAGALPLRLIVVDDGSSDASLAVIERFAGALPIEVLKNETNRGLGVTIQRGLARAAANAVPGDVVVTMDADNTHPPEMIPAMLAKLERGYDLVIASRYEGDAQVVGLSLFRRAMTLGARLLFRVLIPIPGVRDYTCGFRAYRAELLVRLGGQLAEERGFACMAEILLKCAAAGARIGEAPLELRYDLKGGPSKMNVPATALKILRLAWRNRTVARRAPKQPRP
ncbi:MAG: glycosyltransferase [Acidobacteria bacterium]|nr:glycosyltransferase [Acidobacteriota bacterium]